MRVPPRALRFDADGERILLASYAVACALFLAVTDEPAQRLWAQIAIGPYVIAFLLSLATRWRSDAARCALVGCVAVPLAALVWSSHGQPEVEVVRQGASHLLTAGTPYLADPGTLYDFRPYLPAMFLLGLGPGLLGDARVLGTALLCVGVALQVGWPRDRPVEWFRGPAGRRLAVLFACPVVAVAVCTSGIDSAQAGMTLMGLAAYRYRAWVAAGVVLGLAVALKPLGLCAVFVIGVAAYRRGSIGASGRVFGASALVVALTVVPFLLVDWAALARNAIAFPAGAAGVESPAESPFPGVLLREAGAPELVTISVVVVAAVGYALYCLRSRAVTVSAVAAQTACGFVVAFAVVPYSRAGYLMLPALVWFPVVIGQRWHPSGDEVPTTDADR